MVEVWNLTRELNLASVLTYHSELALEPLSHSNGSINTYFTSR